MVHLDQAELAPLPTVVFVVVHPINTAAHPSQPPGFRWSVMLGPCPPSHINNSVNAGWCPTAEAAKAEGEQNGTSVLAALTMVGVNVRAAEQVIFLDHDPIPAGADSVRVL